MFFTIPSKPHTCGNLISKILQSHKASITVTCTNPLYPSPAQSHTTSITVTYTQWIFLFLKSYFFYNISMTIINKK